MQGPTDPPNSAAWPRWLALLKVGKVTFWFIWITPAIFGYIASAHGAGHARHLGWFVLAVIGICWLEAVNCLHNELVDREEDAANQPNRAALIAAIGPRTGWALVRVGYAANAVGLVLLAIFVGPTPALMMLVGGLAAPAYNWGPRLKRRPYLAEIAIGWAVFFDYLSGWSFNQSITHVRPVIWVLTFFFAAASLVKDLPDVTGDELVGAGALFSVRRAHVRQAMLLFVYLSPYVLIVVLAATGTIEARLLWLLVLIPAGLAVMALGERVASLLEGIAVYELAFLYVHIFFLALFVLDVPTEAAAIAAACLFAGRVLSLWLGLAPRFVEPGQSLPGSLRKLAQQS